MSFYHVIFMLFAESFAREKQVSYAWNSTAYSECTVDGVRLYDPVTAVLDSTTQLLKQGLKIGYLPPSRYNCKFVY